MVNVKCLNCGKEYIIWELNKESYKSFEVRCKYCGERLKIIKKQITVKGGKK